MKRMLPSYDAEAVAQVLGIGFLRAIQDVLPPNTEPVGIGKALDRSSNSYLIEIDGSPILVINLKGDDVHLVQGRSRVMSAFHVENASSLTVENTSFTSPSSILIEKAVETGLPRQALRHVAEWLAGDDAAKVSRLERSVVPRTTLDRRAIRLSPEESERTERVARLAVHAQRALGTETEAREFMTTPHPRLDGRTPLEVARTDLGTRRVEGILNALEYGLAL